MYILVNRCVTPQEIADQTGISNRSVKTMTLEQSGFRNVVAKQLNMSLNNARKLCVKHLKSKATWQLLMKKHIARWQK